MLKKPLFWIIVIIVIVVLWFVFGSRGGHSAMGTSAGTTPAASAPATTN